LVTRQKLRELGWEPTDYHLLRSLQNSFNDKTFDNDDAIKSHLYQFFADKGQKFCQRGIMKLPERWRKVTKQNGKPNICFYLISHRYCV